MTPTCTQFPYTDPDTGATLTLVSGGPGTGKTQVLYEMARKGSLDTLFCSTEQTVSQVLKGLGDEGDGVLVVSTPTVEDLERELSRLPRGGLVLVDGFTNFEGTRDELVPSGTLLRRVLSKAHEYGHQLVVSIQTRRLEPSPN